MTYPYLVTGNRPLRNLSITKMYQPEPTEQFSEMFASKIPALQPEDSATEMWKTLQDSMHSTALATFARKTSKSNDWFDAKINHYGSLKPNVLH